MPLSLMCNFILFHLCWFDFARQADFLSATEAPADETQAFVRSVFKEADTEER